MTKEQKDKTESDDKSAGLLILSDTSLTQTNKDKTLSSHGVMRKNT